MPRTTDNGLALYLSAIEREPRLDRARELDLGHRARRHGDAAARGELIRGHLRSVVRIARGFRGYGIPLSDLICQGNLGLIEAADRFDAGRGLRFITYAHHWIRARILGFVLREWSLVEMGTGVVRTRLFFRLSGQSWRLLGNKTGDGDIDAELAAHFGTTVDVVRAVKSRLDGRDVSLDAPCSTGDGTLADQLVAAELGPEQRCQRLEELDLLHRALATLWPRLAERQRVIVRQRLLSDEPRSLRSLGRELGISGERVRQLESDIVDRLRELIPRLSRDDSSWHGPSQPM